ncbi:MAG: DUF368 domain-containing protein [Deltaproteobacteria bacterium]|nr:DUF368 domain-containing protein [Deltaproteobacteria bacterium]
MGASDVVPGVSGGTMAFILGIYEELIRAIRSFDLNFIRLLLSRKIGDAIEYASCRFLVAVGLGIFIAIFSLARALSWLLENQPVLIWSFFFGLILASILVVNRYLNQWNLSISVWILMGTVGAYLLIGIVPVSTPNSPWFLFLSGAIAICAMILPGISGSFILVLLGKYHYFLEAVNNWDLFTLILGAAGAGFGLITFVRLLNWLLKRHHDLIIAVLIGLMLGSLRKVWPWKMTLENVTGSHGDIISITQSNVLPQQWNYEVVTAICLMVVGFLVIIFLNTLSEKMDDRQ